MIVAGKFMKRLAVAAVLAVGAVATSMVAGVAVSAPVTIGGTVDADRGTAVTKVHEGCHYDCRFSPRLGWHNHSNADCRPEPCGPRRGPPIYDAPRTRPGYGGGHHHGGNPCHYDCRFSPDVGWHNHSNANCRPEPCRGR